MESIRGIVSHKKLMELKSSGTVKPYQLEYKLQKMYSSALVRVQDALLDINDGFCWRRFRFYNEDMARFDSRLMFESVEEMVDHLHSVNGESIYIPITADHVGDMLFTSRAANAAHVAADVLALFRSCNEVIVDSRTATLVDWLIQNATRVRSILEAEGDHYE